MDSEEINVKGDWIRKYVGDYYQVSALKENKFNNLKKFVVNFLRGG